MQVDVESDQRAPGDNGPASPWHARSIPLARLLARALVGAVVLGIVSEVAARADDARRFGTPWSAVPDLTNDLVLHDSLGVRGRPLGTYQQWRLNSAGFRSPESTLTPVAGCVRVMTLGSSESFGYEESPGHEYPAQLADALKRDGCFQVMNAAIVGVSVPAMRQLFERWASRYQPDVVVILPNPLAYLGNEPPKAPALLMNATPRRTGWWRPRLPGKMRDLVQFPAFIQRRRIERMVDALASGRPPEWFFREIPPDRLQRFRDDVDSLVQSIRTRGAEPVLVVHPLRFRTANDAGALQELQAMRQFGARPMPEVLFDFDSAGARVMRDIAARLHVPIADVPPLMNGRRELFVDPVHYSNAGAAVIADAVAVVVRGTTPAAHGRAR